MGSPTNSKRLRLRRPDRCLVCQRKLPAGQEALWHRDLRRVTCLGCEPSGEIVMGDPGASALREYERRHRRREDHAREKLGTLGVVLARVIDEPTSTAVWRQGGQGEGRTAARLAKHLEDGDVRLLHDRQVPGHGQANIDHLAIGPGGVTVIDSKTHRGDVHVEHVGGLFSSRRQVLQINGRDQTTLIDGVERQVEYVRQTLADTGEAAPSIRGAMCFPNTDGLPLFRQLMVRDIVIDGPKPVARLAARPGPLQPEDIVRIWQVLARQFPPA